MIPRRALISVHDPKNLVDLVQRLLDMGADVVASEDNAAFLRQKGVGVRTVDELLGRPPGAGKRVETLDARIHAGIAYGDTPEDAAALKTLGAAPIDVVVVNLPPPLPAGQPLDAVLGAADLHRPALLQSAATSYARGVVVLVDPDEYGRMVQKILDYEQVPIDDRRDLAIRALATLARYVATLARTASTFDEKGEPRPTPELYARVVERTSDLRGGDNPQQSATLYAEPNARAGTLPQAIMYGTGEAELPSAAQMREAARALDLVAEIATPTATVSARGRPLAVVAAATSAAAVSAALRGSMPMQPSAPLVASNTEIDAPTAAKLLRNELHTIVAPSFETAALDAFAEEAGPCIIATRGVPAPGRAGHEAIEIPSGVVLETRDATADGEVANGKVVTQRQPTVNEIRVLDFAWKVAKHAPSDAIVLAREDEDGTLRTVGIGAAAPSRRIALEQALTQAGPAAAGAVLASDGPIEQRAEIDLILSRGVLAVVHPGSANDVENVAGGSHVLAMIATGVTHFRA
jgi:phosphoribosylaminoimidazolecarboxamide formyltransferase/IMP cyclohydrolase